MYEVLVKRLLHSANFAERGLTPPPSELREAAAAIEELSKQLDDMNEANIALYGAVPKWIPVSERMPDVPGTYLVLMKEPKKFTEKRIKGEVEEWENFDFSHVEPVFYNKDQNIWDDDDIPMNANLDCVNTYEAFHVTHWMPLPEPPKEEES